MSQTMQVLKVELLDDSIIHGADAVCHYADISLNELIEMVEEGILEPTGSSPDYWQFSYRDFQRSRIVARLFHDLNVNYSGAAVILNFLENRI